MQKAFITFIISAGIMFFVQSSAAQIAEALQDNDNHPAVVADDEAGRKDTLFTIAGDSLLFDSIIDSLGFEDTPIPNENLNDIFSAKMDSLQNSWYIKNLFHLNDSDIGSSGEFPRNLPDSIYISRLKDIEEVIDLSYNEVVKNVIILYTEKRRDLVEIMLGLSAYYFPVFEEILDRHNLPLELKYLPIIESALNPRALSRAGANGLWQFMYGTARQFGLEISSFVDERRDPVVSTEAAAKYLSFLYETYNDWYLAITAYNCGPGNLNRAIRRSGNKTSYWEIYYHLPRETRGYVPAYVAAAYVMRYYKEHNLQPRFPEISLKTDTVLVNEYLHFDQISAVLNMDKEQLRSLNPMFRRDVIPAKTESTYPLVLPNEKIMKFIDSDTTLFAHEREKYFPSNKLQGPVTASSTYFTPADVAGKAKVVYTVKSGDNIGFISSWFNVRTSDLRYWNNINRNLIRAGQKLAVYVPENQKERYEKINSMTFAQKQASIGKSATAESTVKTEAVLDSNYEYYTVRNGDTIWEIAKKYAGISPDDILRLNNLTNRSKLSIGQKIKIKRKS